jgi:hypothetical protein
VNFHKTAFLLFGELAKGSRVTPHFQLIIFMKKINKALIFTATVCTKTQTNRHHLSISSVIFFGNILMNTCREQYTIKMHMGNRGGEQYTVTKNIVLQTE